MGILLIFFLSQIAYISYCLPQVVLKGLEFPEDIKLSMISAAFCLGIMYFIKPPLEEKKSKNTTNQDNNTTDFN
jgi:hypothetical protein